MSHKRPTHSHNQHTRTDVWGGRASRGAELRRLGVQQSHLDGSNTYSDVARAARAAQYREWVAGRRPNQTVSSRRRHVVPPSSPQGT